MNIGHELNVSVSSDGYSFEITALCASGKTVALHLSRDLAYILMHDLYKTLELRRAVIQDEPPNGDRH